MTAQLSWITVTDVTRMSWADPERETRARFVRN
jgi:hypothetical protein